MLPGVSTIDEESMNGSMVISPVMEKDDPLDRIECRGSEGMPLTPLPPLGGFGQAGSKEDWIMRIDRRCKRRNRVCLF